jgi:RimJ/RimL family protein N-acetyltransferase
MHFPADVPTLTSGDITLRAHRIDDIDAIVEQCTDAESIRWTTVPLGYDRVMAETWVTTSIPARWEDGSERVFAIETTHPDGRRRFSGSLSLRDEGDHRAELAFGAHPAVRGRGVMTTAVNLLLDHGFTECGIETVVWLAEVGNLASRRVAWKAGFTFGGVMPKWLGHRGAMVDAWVGTLHRDDPREPTTPWYDVPVIHGDNVTLRPLRDSDADRVAEGCADERTQEWLEFLPSPYTLDDAHDFLRRIVQRGASAEGLTWAAADPETDLLLGVIGVPRSAHGSREIGYWAHPDARGKGVVSEGVEMLLRHVFLGIEDGGLGARRAYLKAAAGNAASHHVAITNGFTECGRERQSTLKRDGSTDDLVVFDLLATEWEARQA